MSLLWLFVKKSHKSNYSAVYTNTENALIVAASAGGAKRRRFQKYSECFRSI